MRMKLKMITAHQAEKDREIKLALHFMTPDRKMHGLEASFDPGESAEDACEKLLRLTKAVALITAPRDPVLA